MKIGREGYVANTKLILDASQKMRAALREEVPEVNVATDNNGVVVALTTRPEKGSINCIALANVMKDFKWMLCSVQRPSGVHIAITLATAPVWRKFVDDVKASVKKMKENPELNHNSSVAMYGLANKIPDGNFMGQMAKIHSAALLDSL